MCFRPPELNKSMHKCLTCGQVNRLDAKVCKKCGAEIIRANGRMPGMRRPATHKK